MAPIITTTTTEHYQCPSKSAVIPAERPLNAILNSSIYRIFNSVIRVLAHLSPTRPFLHADLNLKITPIKTWWSQARDKWPTYINYVTRQSNVTRQPLDLRRDIIHSFIHSFIHIFFINQLTDPTHYKKWKTSDIIKVHTMNRQHDT